MHNRLRQTPLGGCVLALLFCLVTILSSLTALAQDSASTIEAIEFRGNRRVPAATMRSRVFSKPGDPYNEAALRRDFMALYNSQLFEDITLRVEDGERGKIVIFEVREKPNIRSIEYKGNKSVTTSDILDRFKERRPSIPINLCRGHDLLPRGGSTGAKASLPLIP